MKENNSFRGSLAEKCLMLGAIDSLFGISALSHFVYKSTSDISRRGFFNKAKSGLKRGLISCWILALYILLGDQVEALSPK